MNPFEYSERKPQWAQQMKNLEPFTGSVVVFNVEHPIDPMFYHNCIAYRNVPDVHTIEGILESGYDVIINENGQLDRKYHTLEKVRMIRFISPEQ
jgi:hypothetical protein